MRIAVWHNLPSGGGKRALFEHVKGLLSRGHAVDVWCPPTADTSFLPLSALTQEVVLPLEPQQIKGLPRRLFQAARADVTPFERMAGMRAHAALFAEAVNREPYDVAFINPCRWFYTPFVGGGIRVPLVAYLHEPCRRLYEARPELPWIAERPAEGAWWGWAACRHWLASAARVHGPRVQAREELDSIRRFNRVLVNSRFSREMVLRAFNVDASVCYLGIDPDRFANQPAARDSYVLSVGEFAEHKRPLFIIRALAASRRKPPLVWVANRVNQEHLEKALELSRSLGVILEVKTNVPEHELVRYHQRAALFLYAPHLEPFGLTPLEASSCGTAVIAVAEGGVRETVEHNQTGLCIDSDPREMSSAIDALLDDPVQTRALGQRGAQRVREQWSPEAATARLEQHLLAAVRAAR